MDKSPNMSKRDFMKTMVGIGGASAVTHLIASGGSVKEAHAQILESGISPDSVLAKIKKEGKLRIGYSQTPPWFLRDAKTNELGGIYFDVAERLAKEIEVKLEWMEVAWANATIALRKGDFDVFGSSLFYTMPRALVVNYVGPMWRKGRLVLTHKDFAHRFKSAADFNSPDVTFSVNVGASEENWIKVTFPKAKIITTSGQITLSAEPVRTKKAHLWASGEEDTRLMAKKNQKWAVIIDEEHPLGLTPNTWAIRYGDQDWKFFLDFWGTHMFTSGFMKERYDFWINKMIA
jgi:polar amino acid transport system substrate-binding protein